MTEMGQKELERELESIKKLFASRDTDSLVDRYERFARNAVVCPDKDAFPRPNNGDMVDVSKSVAWNKQEVLRLRSAYRKEYDRLKRLEECVSRAYYDGIVSLLASEYEMSVEEARVVYAEASEEMGQIGVHAVRRRFENLADMALHLKAIWKREEEIDTKEANNSIEKKGTMF